MKLITWNVNGIRAIEKNGFSEFLKKEDPDILCLQETKAHPDLLDSSLTHLKDRVSYWSASQIKKGYSGVASFFKKNHQNFEVQKVSKKIGIRKFDLEGRFLITKLKDFTIYNVYFPNGSMNEERHLFKQDFLKKFHYFLKKQIQKGEEIILVGDYNIAHTEIDIHDPIRLAQTSGFLPEERKWFSEFLAYDFVDVFRYFYPHKKNCYTWWSYRENARKNNRGWRIDYICVTKGLVHRLKSIEILNQQKGSDHCPIVLQLNEG